MKPRTDSSLPIPLPEGAEVEWLEPDIALFSLPVPEAQIPEGLTSSEAAITRLVFDGASNADIAAQRSTTSKTVGNQLESIFRKLGVASRWELVVLLRGAKVPSSF